MGSKSANPNPDHKKQTMKKRDTLRPLRRWPLYAYVLLLLAAPAARAEEPPPKELPPPPATPALKTIDMGGQIQLRGRHLMTGGGLVPPDLPEGAGLEMVIPRAGQASAQALLTGEKLEGITAGVTALTGPQGAVLPATEVSVRYLTGPVFADQLAPQPVETQRQPILVTVKVPAAAAPGIYRGQLQVSCAGFTGQLPVQVEVMEWLLPPKEQWRTMAGLLHSPDSVALQYNVEPWSDRHLALMESSLRLLADLGGRDAKIYLIANGVEKERYSMVRYRDGKPDFTCVDRYLDLWQKTCGTPRTITLYLWDNTRRAWDGKRWNDRLVDSYTAANSVQVTGIGADGKLTNFPAPYYTTPEAGAFWKPVCDGLKARVAKRGWKETEMLLGHPWDSWPQEEAVEFLQQAAGLRWRVFSHAFNYPKPDAQGRLFMPCGAEVGWQETCVPVGDHRDSQSFNALMKRVYAITTAGRNTTVMVNALCYWRDYPATAIRKGVQGISQVGIDFWDLPKDGNLLRNPVSGFEPRHDTAKAITVPGPNGAEPLVQYLMLQEGLQVCEAWWRVRDGGNVAVDKAFDDFLAQRQQCKNHHTPKTNITDQGRWHQAIRDLYRAAAANSRNP
jgi:hypothetical protein